MQSFLENRIGKKGLIAACVMFVTLCVLGFAFPAHAGILETFGTTVGNAILSVAALVTYVGGLILDKAISLLVLRMGGMLADDSGLGYSVNTLWATIRDICNLAFVFGFIYIGVRSVINYDSSQTKRVLASIIIGALLINFSLFFTKVVIDAGNFLAVELHGEITRRGGLEISAQIAKILGVSSVYNISTSPQILEESGRAGTFSFYVMSAIFLIVAGFVLAAGGILLIVRFVTLIFIMIFSPVLFAGHVFPATKSFAEKLLKTLISNAFFAPAYLFLLFLSLKILQGAMVGITGSSTPSRGAFAAAFGTGNEQAFSIVILFIVCIMALIMSLKIASQMGIKGGDMAVSVGKDWAKKGRQYMGKAAGSATLGIGAAGLRATVGRRAHDLSESGNLKDAASRRGFWGWASRQKLKVSRAVGDASFDARRVGDVGKKLGIGEGSKGGYTTKLKEIEEKEMKFAKSLGEVGDDDVRVDARKKEAENIEKTLRILRDERSAAKTPEDKLTISAQIRKLEDEQKKANKDYEKEKQRRILGSTYSKQDNVAAVKSAKAELEAQEKNLQEMWDKYLKSTDKEAREDYRDAIETVMKQVAEAEKKYKYERSQTSKEDGYASVLKNSRFYDSWLRGRMVKQDKKAGEAIEKAFEKKIKKSKEDSRTDSIVDAVKSSSSKS